MASQGRGRRGRPPGVNQVPPVFYQQSFVEAIRVAVTDIA